MNKFAKLVEVEAGQVLATIEEADEDPSGYQVNLRLDQNGTTVTYKLSARSREHAQRMLEITDESVAQGLYSRLTKFDEYANQLINQYNATVSQYS